MTYEEEILDGISKASKSLRKKVKTLVGINSENIQTEKQKEIDEIYDSVTDEEVESFNSLLIAVNGIIRKKDAFNLVYMQLYEVYDNIVRILKSIRDLEDKATLLNIIAKNDKSEAESVFKNIVSNDRVCKIELTPSGLYRVESIKFKDTMRKELKKFKESMSHAKTLWVCLEDYAKRYKISDIIPTEISEVMEDIKVGFVLDSDLYSYYEKYSGNPNGLNSRISHKIDFVLDEEEPTEKKQNIFQKYEDSEPIKNALKLNLFKV